MPRLQGPLMNRHFTQAAVAIIGMIGLVAAAIITLFITDLGDERNLLLGGLIAATSTSAAWLFRNGQSGGHVS